MIAVDTSVLVDLFRGRRTAAADRLRQIEADRISFVLPAVCCQELLQGARDEREWKLLHEYLRTQRLLTGGLWETHLDAARIFYDCRRRGITIRSTVDCWIAQLTLEGEHFLLHDDDDFDRISEVRPLRLMRG